MAHLNHKIANLNKEQAYNFIQTYSIKQGLKRFNHPAKKFINTERLQIHNQKSSVLSTL